MKLNSYLNPSVFYCFVELKKVQLKKRFTLMTYDSIGHLKTLCRSVYR